MTKKFIGLERLVIIILIVSAAFHLLQMYMTMFNIQTTGVSKDIILDVGMSIGKMIISILGIIIISIMKRKK